MKINVNKKIWLKVLRLGVFLIFLMFSPTTKALVPASCPYGQKEVYRDDSPQLLSNDPATNVFMPKHNYSCAPDSVFIGTRILIVVAGIIGITGIVIFVKKRSKK